MLLVLLLLRRPHLSVLNYTHFIHSPRFHSVFVLLVLEDSKQRVVHQQVVKLLELLQRVLVVLAGTLRQDVHLKVGLGDLRLISLLITCRVLLSLALKSLLNKVTNSRSKIGQAFGRLKRCLRRTPTGQIVSAVSV